MIKLGSWFLIVAAFLTIAGCGATPTIEPVEQNDITKLATQIQGLGSGVAPAEAERAAEIAYRYSLQLAQEYQVTDPPLVHNAKVIHGYRPRGLCNHWTEDLNKRLKQEHFRTLSLHWAISPPTPFRIIHHTVIISARGDTLDDGIVLDPWRNSGALFWSKTKADDHYNWRPRMEVREELLNG
ncbi:hypothetical protein [Roseovarius pelagicus]|uniref:Lipoprotein n=1 Tax=Roseovarius pelagicus TaxID=2980108 RepID=A0ABY6DLK3_9RHOB|nr:hypothetical protein [Roseovarius pelagicus]UXX84650.1 hypothetical protein N7U68_08455 [Roseovarius pelagicus]